MELEKNAATYAFNLSNWLLGLMIAKEILVVVFLFFFNDLAEAYICGMGMFIVLIYIILFCLGIPISIQIFKASKDAGSKNGGLVGSGILFVIGLIIGVMMVPFFTFFFVMGMYIFTYHVIRAEKRGTFGVSIFIFFVATFFTYMGFFIRNATGLWLTVPLGILTSILFIISHSMHIKLNNRAKMLWKPVGKRTRPAPRQQRIYGQKPQYSYHERPPTPPARQPPTRPAYEAPKPIEQPPQTPTYEPQRPVDQPPPSPVYEPSKDGGAYNKRIQEAPKYTGSVKNEPVVKKADDKPRMLDAPPGYD